MAAEAIKFEDLLKWNIDDITSVYPGFEKRYQTVGLRGIVAYHLLELCLVELCPAWDILRERERRVGVRRNTHRGMGSPTPARGTACRL